MKNFVQDGRVISVTAPYNLASGGGCRIGGIFGVSNGTYLSGNVAQIHTQGVFDIVKATGAVTAGDDIYWDNTNKVVTTVAAGNKRIGVAIAAALSGDASARVLLDRANNPRFFVSAEQTGTGSNQNVAHGLGEVPAFVFITYTDLTPATAGSANVTYGTHTSTNAVVNVTSGKKFLVVAIAG